MCIQKTDVCSLRGLEPLYQIDPLAFRFFGGLGRCKTGAISNAQNYLCWNHSAETTFEPHGKKLQDASAILGTFGSFLEAPGALENGAFVCALASLCRNPSSRLRGLGTFMKPSFLPPRFGHFGGGAKIELMSGAFAQVAEPPKWAHKRCSRLRSGPGLAETPSAV